MKALSLWEPWATLMAIGAKRVETRSWRALQRMTRYRGPLLICAAVRYKKSELKELFEIEEFRVALRNEPLSFGKAVAVVHLDGCMPTHKIRHKLSAEELAFGDYSLGRFAWMTSGLRRIRPVPVKGAQGIFEVDLEPEDLEDFP